MLPPALPPRSERPRIGLRIRERRGLDLDAWPKNEGGAAWPISFPAGWSGEGRLSIEALVWQAGIISQVRGAARLVAMNMALEGVPRDEIAKQLEADFGPIAGVEALLDDVLQRAGR